MAPAISRAIVLACVVSAVGISGCDRSQDYLKAGVTACQATDERLALEQALVDASLAGAIPTVEDGNRILDIRLKQLNRVLDWRTVPPPTSLDATVTAEVDNFIDTWSKASPIDAVDHCYAVLGQIEAALSGASRPPTWTPRPTLPPITPEPAPTLTAVPIKFSGGRTDFGFTEKVWIVSGRYSVQLTAKGEPEQYATCDVWFVHGPVREWGTSLGDPVVRVTGVQAKKAKSATATFSVDEDGPHELVVFNFGCGDSLNWTAEVTR
jgi:hypothetical protein